MENNELGKLVLKIVSVYISMTYLKLKTLHLIALY